jgi:DNA polymerase-3 subunit delta
MMADYQVVMVKEAQDMKWGRDDDDKKSINPLLNYLENPLPSTILVFCYKYGKFDKRKKTYKAIEKNGLVFESAVYTIVKYRPGLRATLPISSIN